MAKVKMDRAACRRAVSEGLGRVSSSTMTLALLVAVAAACGNSASPHETVSVGRATIVGGVADTTSEAVVLVKLTTGQCTGSMIAVDGTRGFVLTAAHCLTSNPATAVERWGMGAAVATYNVVGQQACPQYASITGAFDFAILALDLLTDSPPVVGLVGVAGVSDPLAVGSSVTMVGFGRTVGGTGADPQLLARRRVTLPVSALDAYTARFDVATQGPCFGDSGGPGLVDVGGALRLATVASTFYSGGTSCTGTVAEARVTSGFAWIDQSIKSLGGSGLPGLAPSDGGPTADADAVIPDASNADGATDAPGVDSSPSANTDPGRTSAPPVDGGRANGDAADPDAGGCSLGGHGPRPQESTCAMALVLAGIILRNRACRRDDGRTSCRARYSGPP